MVVDLGNLLLTFDESLARIIEHLEKGYPDRALIRAKETRKTFQAVMKKLTPEVMECIEKRI
jgi:hypothetical protein